MLPQRIQNALNTRLDAIWPDLVASQEAFRRVEGSKGKYAQLLRSHSTEPDGETATNADRLSESPSYQVRLQRRMVGEDEVIDKIPIGTWADFGLNTFRERFALEIHQYKTPSGECGWVAIATVKHGGKVYRKARGVGPEDRDRDWEELSDG